jgi:hypothetical protein
MHPSESTARLLVAVLVFGGTALIIAILTWRRPSADGPITPGCWWGLPYGFGAVSVAFGLLVPEPEWREPMWDGGPPFTLAITLTGLGLLLVEFRGHHTRFLDARHVGCDGGRMARLARVVVPGYPHHLTQRGNGR